jgi:heme ABC exporter ATP-binding subunit CcmA
VIELVDVDKDYGDVRALAGVSTRIEGAKLVHVAGPNGAGKSTLLRVVAGLTRPTRGQVRVDGADLFRSAHAARRGSVGYLGAEPGLYGELSVEENLRFFARVHDARAGIELAIERLELGPVRVRPVATLSLGFRRRAGLARLLVQAPALWLLDEPWNGLDAHAASLLAGLLSEQRAAGRGALIAAHLPGEHANLFDVSLALDAGRLDRQEAA